MSRFARTSEEVFLRRKELVDKDRKQGYQETLLLYQIILMHSWGSGKCDKTLPELCQLYDLEYHNSTRRLKILREKSWLENTDKYMRPLLVHRPGKNESVKITTPDQSVNSTPDSSVKITPPSVKITPNECKNYTENDEISVNFTPEKPETPLSANVSGDAKTSFKFKPALETATAAQKNAAAAVETNGHQSQFSIEECLSYAGFCVRRGDPIKSLEGLAHHAWRTGEMDAFIQAALYPEPLSAPTAEADYAEFKRREALEILLDLRAADLEIGDQEQFYAPSDWAWLMEELRNVERI